MQNDLCFEVRTGEGRMNYALHEESGALQVDMEGRFTFLDAKAFSHLLRAIRDKVQVKEVRLNIGLLQSVDSTALSLLMTAYDMALAAHKKLVFVEPHGQVQECLAMAKHYNAITIQAVA